MRKGLGHRPPNPATRPTRRDDAQSTVSTLLAQLHTHEQVAVDHCLECKRIASQIRKIVKKLPPGVWVATANVAKRQPHNDANIPSESEQDIRNQRLLERFSKLL